MDWLYAQLDSQRREVLEYISLRRATICARFLRPIFHVRSRFVYNTNSAVSCKSPFLVVLLYYLCQVSGTLP